MDWGIELRLPKWANLAIPLFLLALNLALKWLYLDHFEIALDEPFTIFHSQKSPAEIIQVLKGYNNPPLFELLLHFWIKLGGISPGWVRLLPLFLSSLTVVVIWLLGSRHLSSLTGLGAGLLYSFSSYGVYVAHDTRAYPLMILLSALTVLLFLEAVQQPQAKLRWAGLFLSGMLLLYTHYMGFFVMLALALTVVLHPQTRKKAVLLPFLVLGLAMVVAYLPQLGIMVERYGKSVGVHWVKASSLDGLYECLRFFSSSPVMATVTLGVLAGAGIRWILQRKQAKPGFSPAWLVFLLLFPLMYLLVFLIGFKMPLFYHKYVSFVLPFYFLVVAEATRKLFPKKINLAALGLLVMGMAASVNLKPDHKLRWKPLMENARAELNQGACLVVFPVWLDVTVAYHYDPDVFSQTERLHEALHEKGIYPVFTKENAEEIPWNNYTKALFLKSEWDSYDPNGEVQGVINSHFPKLQEEQAYHNMRLQFREREN
ncbi:MAG: glycosyltransferase family 39 protein [Bacteroidia bacterium]|nr:glycosyltransferase family 39 protein [Bacteroidia bacterium]